MLCFHDETVEALCREVRASIVYATLGEALAACGRALIEDRAYPAGT